MRVEDQFLYPLFFDFSPYTYYSDHNGAWFVRSDGFVYGNDDVYNSYGASPGTDFHDGAYAIDNRGRFAYDGDSDVDYYSYGSPNTRYGNSAIDVGMNGGVGNNYYAIVDNSYGYKIASLFGHGLGW